MKPNKEKSRNTTKKSSNWNGTKIALVVVGVAFVVFMIVSSLGMSWMSSLKGAKPGDIATISYTIFDDKNRPIVTTNLDLYNQTTKKGDKVFYSNTLKVPVGTNITTNVSRIPVLYQQYQTYFGLFSDEMNLISQGLVGVKQNEQKTISLVMPQDPLETTMTPDQFSKLIGPVNETFVNDQIILALTANPQINLDNTTPVDQYMRTFYVRNISPDGVDMKYGYSTIEFQVIGLNTK